MTKIFIKVDENGKLRDYCSNEPVEFYYWNEQLGIKELKEFPIDKDYIDEIESIVKA